MNNTEDTENTDLNAPSPGFLNRNGSSSNGNASTSGNASSNGNGISSGNGSSSANGSLSGQSSLNGLRLPVSTPQPPPKVLPGASSKNQAGEWIENEELLRDEGTLFGMAGADIDSKVAAIQHYFTARIEEAEGIRRVLEKRLEKVQAALSAESSLSVAGISLAQRTALGDTHFFYCTLKVVLLSAACLSAVPLVETLIERSGTLSGAWAWIVATGIVLSGLFVRITGLNSAAHSDTHSGIRLQWQDWGIALAASIGIAAWCVPMLFVAEVASLSVWVSALNLAGAIVYVTVVFRYAGVALLDAVALWVIARQARLAKQQADVLMRETKENTPASQVNPLQSETNQRQQLALEIEEELYRFDKNSAHNPKRLRALSDYAVSLFRSEYELAQARGRQQVKSPQSNVPQKNLSHS